MVSRIFPALLLAAVASSASCMEIAGQTGSGQLTVSEDGKKVFTYRYGDQLESGVDAKYRRSSYMHPVWSLDGKTELTDDFPEDHPHHRGIYWAWPRVETRGIQSETWHPHDIPLRQHFVRFHEKTVEDGVAVIKVENRWLLREEEEVARELVTIRAHPETSGSRAIDFAIKLEAVGTTLSLAGSPQDQKGYGGFCFRAAPDFKGAKILTDQGPAEADIVNVPRKWTALDSGENAVAIFASPEHPDFPPKWMTRNSYAGFINASWPGLSPVVLEPGKPVTLKYRVIVYQKDVDDNDIKQAYETYSGNENAAAH